MIFVIAGIVVGVLLIVGGVAYAATPGNDQRRSGANERPSNCASACEQLQMRRSELCLARAALDRARAEAEAATGAWTALTVSWGIATAAAVALAAIPLIGWGFAVAAFATAAALLIAADAALGVKLRKDANVVDAARNVEIAQGAVAEAIDYLRAACPPAEADACLNRPDGC